jgi:hypothetical protein
MADGFPGGSNVVVGFHAPFRRPETETVDRGPLVIGKGSNDQQDKRDQSQSGKKDHSRI